MLQHGNAVSEEMAAQPPWQQPFPHSAMVAAQESVQSSKDKYLEAFNKAMAGTMLNPPHFPADFIDKPAVEEGKTADLPKKLSLNFFLPHASFFQKAEVRVQRRVMWMDSLVNMAPPDRSTWCSSLQ
jgi:hypothetical protein